VHEAGAGGESAGDAGNGMDQTASRETGEYGGEFLDLERELAVFLRRARASSGEMAREVHPELESSAYGLLVRLEDAGPQRATALAGYFGVGKATMSRQLRAMEDLGLVARTPDPADGRAWLVHLTDEGRARFGRVRGARRERYGRQLASWDRTEIAELARLLHRLNALSTEDAG
jgi:DNA-binding MarR family transcriptional regulator